MISQRPYELLIFDWDGTLMDSGSNIVSSFQYVCQELGHLPPAPKAIRELIGLGPVEVCKRLFPKMEDTEAHTLAKAFRAHYFSQTSSPLFSGVATALRALRDEGYLLAVATGKSRNSLNKNIEDSGLTGLFAATRTGEETLSKPDPLMLEEILSELDVSPSAAMMVGDTEFDIVMAQRAGVDAIAVGCGTQDPDYLKSFEPKVFLDFVTDLPAWLEMQAVVSESE